MYPLEASLLDIFNFCIACTFTIIDHDLAKGDYFYTVFQSNVDIKKVTSKGNQSTGKPLSCYGQTLWKNGRQY